LRDETKNTLKVAGIYMATVIGAGFASGREIVQFFSKYLQGGFYGLVFSGILFAAVGSVVLNKVFSGRIRNFEEFIFPLLGYRLGWLMEIIVSVFMFAVYSIMLAGAGRIIEQWLPVPYRPAVVLMGLSCTVILFFGIKGVAAVSSALTPLLAAGIIFIGIYVVVTKDTTVFSILDTAEAVTDNWFFSSLLYVSYNSILSTVVLCGLLPYIKTKKTATSGAVIGGMSLCAVALMLNAVIVFAYPESMALDIPMMGILGNFGILPNLLYSFILWLAMVLSAVTAGYGFLGRVENRINVNRRIAAPFMFILALPLSELGFSKLIALLYPVFGYAGMFMVFAILLTGLRDAVRK